MKQAAIHRFIGGFLIILMLCSGIGNASDDIETDRFISQLQSALNAHENGKTEQAIFMIDNASETYLHTNWSYYICGYLISEMGDDERALVHLNKALETDSTYAQAWYYKGKALSGLGRDREAAECFARAEELDERYTVPWTEKWPVSIIFRNLTLIYLVLAFGGLGIYIAKREGKF